MLLLLLLLLLILLPLLQQQEQLQLLLLCPGGSGGYSELGGQSCVDQGTGVRPQGPPGWLDLKGNNAKGFGLKF